uniref:Uncharacterized protein n=1 Tax=Lygus hesperus TaxID=30085 RepID=A0A146LSQ2_LYGHE
MLVYKVVFCVLLVASAEVKAFKELFEAGRNVVKGSVKLGASTVSKGIALGNSALQKGTSLVSNGIEKGALAKHFVVGAGTAVAGHALAVGSGIFVNTTGKVDSATQSIPVLGSLIKAGNDRIRQTVSSVNKVGQTFINGVDSVSDASLALANKATQIGAGIVSNSAKFGAAVSQATVAFGTSVIQTGVDNAFTLGKNIANQVSSGQFNVSAPTPAVVG